ncbi:MAG: DUF47 family protein [Spirochaetales bacterium]|nr:DUF47 family protein [Spirochaetales bacterium]
MKKYPFIFQRLLPKNTPLNLISQHVDCIYQSSLLLNELLRYYFSNEEISRFIEQISFFERKADTIKNELRQLIRNSLKISFTREDILQFIHIQDNIMDSIEDFAKLLFLNRISFIIDKQVEKLLNSLCDEVVNSIKNYKEMIDTFITGYNYGFAKPIFDLQKKNIEQLDDLEHKIDTLSLDLGKIAFSFKDRYNAIDIIHFNNLIILLSKIPNSISRLTDKILDFMNY